MEQILKPEKKQGSILLSTVLFIVFQLTALLFYFVSGNFDLEWLSECILLAIICIGLYISYNRHAKNVMKPLVGGALMWMLFYEMKYAMYYIQYLPEMDSWGYNTPALKFFCIIQVAVFVVIAVINVIHYLINSTHHSSPGKIKANKALFFIFIILLLVQCICEIFIGTGVYFELCDIFGILADVFFLCNIIIIEGSLDEFRIHREAVAEAQTTEEE